jgi:hypothetical protein
MLNGLQLFRHRPEPILVSLVIVGNNSTLICFCTELALTTIFGLCERNEQDSGKLRVDRSMEVSCCKHYALVGTAWGKNRDDRKGFQKG